MPLSTGRFTLCAGFWDTREVVDLTINSDTVDLRPLSLWVLLGTYHASYPNHNVPHGMRRRMGGRPRDVLALVEHGFLIDTGNKNWLLGYHGHLWWITYGRDGNRAPILPEVRAAVFDRDGNTCTQCGRAADLTLDHIVPWSHGGADTVSNFRVLCRSCNSRRGNRVEPIH